MWRFVRCTIVQCTHFFDINWTFWPFFRRYFERFLKKLTIWRREALHFANWRLFDSAVWIEQMEQKSQKVHDKNTQEKNVQFRIHDGITRHGSRDIDHDRDPCQQWQLIFERQCGGEQVHRRACLHQMDRECPAWAAASYHTSIHKLPAGDASTGTVLGKRAGTLAQHCDGISCVIPAGATQGLSRHQMWLMCCTMCSDHGLKVNTGSSVRHTKQRGPAFHQCWADVWVVGPEFKHSRIKVAICLS